MGERGLKDRNQLPAFLSRRKEEGNGKSEERNQNCNLSSVARNLGRGRRKDLQRILHRMQFLLQVLRHADCALLPLLFLRLLRLRACAVNACAFLEEHSL